MDMEVRVSLYSIMLLLKETLRSFFSVRSAFSRVLTRTPWHAFGVPPCVTICYEMLTYFKNRGADRDLLSKSGRCATYAVPVEDHFRIESSGLSELTKAGQLPASLIVSRLPANMTVDIMTFIGL